MRIDPGVQVGGWPSPRVSASSSQNKLSFQLPFTVLSPAIPAAQVGSEGTNAAICF